MLEKFYPSVYAENVFSIDYEKLYRKGCRGIIFDIDNTLVHHGDNSNENVDNLFRRLHETGFRTVLLTDNDEERVKRFIRNIDTPYVCDAGKPDPKGYLKALEIMKIRKKQAVVIGDQIFTDILGANRAGIKSIMVKFIRLPEEKYIGKRRYLEKFILLFDRRRKWKKQRKLFCEINPFCYALSEKKGIMQRHISDFFSREKFAHTIISGKLPNIVSKRDCGLIKHGKGIDIRLQENKADNIRLACSRINGIVIRPNEVFSFWKTVGNTTRRKGYKDGRVIIGNQLIAGIGGGLCNLGNMINLLVLDSPLEITEFHTHSDALAPDNGKRVPLSSGTSIAITILTTVSGITPARIYSCLYGATTTGFTENCAVKRNFRKDLSLLRKTIISGKKGIGIIVYRKFTKTLLTALQVKLQIRNLLLTIIQK